MGTELKCLCAFPLLANLSKAIRPDSTRFMKCIVVSVPLLIELFPRRSFTQRIEYT